MKCCRFFRREQYAYYQPTVIFLILWIFWTLFFVKSYPLILFLIVGQFDVKDLGKLQFIIFSLIITLIDKLDYHKNKISILNEIDDAIVNAY